jgi:hypothetical protein
MILIVSGILIGINYTSDSFINKTLEFVIEPSNHFTYDSRIYVLNLTIYLTFLNWFIIIMQAFKIIVVIFWSLDMMNIDNAIFVLKTNILGVLAPFIVRIIIVEMTNEPFKEKELYSTLM